MESRKLEVALITRLEGANKFGFLGTNMKGLAQKTGMYAKNMQKAKTIATKLTGIYSGLGKRERIRVAQQGMAAHQREKEEKNAAKYGMTLRNFNGALNKLNIVKKKGKYYDVARKNALVKHNELTKRLKASTQRFRMELLGVMFAGQNLAKMMSGLLRPAMDATGVFDIWNSMLQVIFLPTALAATSAVLKLWRALDKMPAVKGGLNIVVPTLGVTGTIIAAYGSIALAIYSIRKATVEWGIASKWLKEGWGIASKWLKEGWGDKIGKIGSAFVILEGAIRSISGYMSGDFWKFVSGGIIIAAGVIAFTMGGWLPALIAGAIALVIILGDKFEWLGKTIQSIFWPLKALFALSIETGAALRTGNWSGFGRDVMAMSNPGTWWGGGTPMQQKQDFIWRSGQGAIGISPNDNLVGTKGGAGMGGNFSPVINFNNPTVNNTNARDFAKQVLDILYVDLRRLGIR